MKSTAALYAAALSLLAWPVTSGAAPPKAAIPVDVVEPSPQAPERTPPPALVPGKLMIHPVRYRIFLFGGYDGFDDTSVKIGDVIDVIRVECTVNELTSPRSSVCRNISQEEQAKTGRFELEPILRLCNKLHNKPASRRYLGAIIESFNKSIVAAKDVKKAQYAWRPPQPTRIKGRAAALFVTVVRRHREMIYRYSGGGQACPTCPIGLPVPTPTGQPKLTTDYLPRVWHDTQRTSTHNPYGEYEGRYVQYAQVKQDGETIVTPRPSPEMRQVMQQIATLSPELKAAMTINEAVLAYQKGDMPALRAALKTLEGMTVPAELKPDETITMLQRVADGIWSGKPGCKR